eukprot:1619421-Rhodomonas_salina.1
MNAPVPWSKVSPERLRLSVFNVPCTHPTHCTRPSRKHTLPHSVSLQHERCSELRGYLFGLWTGDRDLRQAGTKVLETFFDDRAT